MNSLVNSHLLASVLSCFLLACTADIDEQEPAKSINNSDASSQLIEIKSIDEKELPHNEAILAIPKQEKVLDLSWDRKTTRPIPEIKEQHLLPNFFADKNPEKKRTSVGGKIYRNDDPNMPLIDAVEGGEVSVKVLIP